MPYDQLRKIQGKKLGLALSGGGFRASLFHLGVLAQLAECELLSQVEEISCVSGGSIIGALYYLKVKELFEGRRWDGLGPGRKSYLRIVSEIEDIFLAGIQQNIRMRLFLDPFKNSKMIQKTYSKADRLGELLHRYFYRNVWDSIQKQTHSKSIPLARLAINPDRHILSELGFFEKIISPYFQREAYNEIAAYKVPNLIINATSLNSGHLWQFTPYSVGEQVSQYELQDKSNPIFSLIWNALTQRETDFGRWSKEKKEKSRRITFSDAAINLSQKKQLMKISLGKAVAASCCVPGIFSPIQIPGLLLNESGEAVTIRLVDGGVYDNQGLVSLFAAGCDRFIVSDASEILRSSDNLASGTLNSAMRANQILMERVRHTLLSELKEYGEDHFVFLSLGEQANHIFPLEQEKIIKSISLIRTDMDSFNEIESFFLMYYGYTLSQKKMTSDHKNDDDNHGDSIKRQTKAKRQTNDDLIRLFQFLKIQDFFDEPKFIERALHHLDIGQNKMFKVFYQKKVFPYLLVLPWPVLLVLLTLYATARVNPVIFSSILGGMAFLVLYWQFNRLVSFIERFSWLNNIFQKIVSAIVALQIPAPFAFLGSLVSRIHLSFFDQLFLSYGSLAETAKRIRKEPKESKRS